MKDKTFADYLMRHGVDLPSDTVVINATDIVNYYGGSHKLEQRINNIKQFTFGSTIRPIFDNMIIEYEMGNYSDNTDHFGYGKTSAIFCHTRKIGSDNIGNYTQTFMRLYQYLPAINDELFPIDDQLIEIMNIGHFQYNIDHDVLVRQPNNIIDNDTAIIPELFWRACNHKTDFEWDDAGYFMGCVTLLAMNSINKKCPVELITHSRGIRRNIKRKTGKEPSPYFMLKIDSTKPEKRYKPSGRKTGIKQSQHIVRGHFRTVVDHPLKQFNGTFWIPSHMRGDKSRGETLKGYTIVLPDKEDNND
jgi:hypothetical protein